MTKVVIYALHLKLGGVESAIVNFANMLADDFDVEIVVFYKYEDLSYDIDSRVKITYLTSYQSNKQELILSLKSGKNIVRNIWLAIDIYLKRRFLINKHIKTTSADVLVSTRLLYHDLVSNSRSSVVKICQEHVDHKENNTYISKVIRATKNADYLMPVSKFLADSYEAKLANKRIKPTVKHIRHAVKLPDSIDYKFSKNLISVGRLSPEKGFLDLIDVLKLIVERDPKYKLNLIGDGLEREFIEKKIISLKLQNNINLHGFLSKTSVEHEISKAGLYVLPSYEESFGLVIIESFAYGVPVVAFDSARGAVELLSNNNAGKLILNRNKEDMANWILNLSPKEAKEMSNSAVKAAKAYDFDKIERELINFIKEAVRIKSDT